MTISKFSAKTLFTLLVIIIAGELIYSLPFHIPRFFRPTFLDVFSLTNTQLGDIFAVYGVVAMISYFPGGVIADHFAPRQLMAFSLLTTALGGVYLATFPPAAHLYFIFGYWGCTSVLLFWSAMIKQTRSLGGEDSQGIAFGLLDGGRGLVASLVASAAVIILANFLVSDDQDLVMKQQSMKAVILFYTGMTLMAGCLVWFGLKDEVSSDVVSKRAKFKGLGLNQHWQDIRLVLRDPKVWLQGGIIVCAYCGYKALDNYGLYATQVLQMSQVDAASLTAMASYARPFAAVAAGLIADRWLVNRSIFVFFGLAAAAFITMLFTGSALTNWVVANIIVTFVAVYAIRAVYFALVEQSQLGLGVTGTAVGLISLIGYTPDIFFASVTGRILDANPGLTGFQHYFMLLSGLCVMGMVLAHWFSIRLRSSKEG